ncbi:MAG: imidazoleglycerol-phosphate dehydratase, partial [Desulfotignum sp.]
MARDARVSRQTKETKIEVQLDLDGTGNADISTGIPFFDHMLTAFCVHGFFDLKIIAAGDLGVDLHHTVEDVGLVLGQALATA